MSSHKIRHTRLNEANAPEPSGHSLLSVGILALGLAMTASSPALGSGSFSKTGSMNVARLYHTATLLANGEVLVVGGVYSLAAQQTAEVYNPAKGKFTLAGNLNTGRWSHQAVLLPDGRVLVAGGFDTNDNFTASAELYNPSTGTWTPTGSMSTGRVDFVLTDKSAADLFIIVSARGVELWFEAPPRPRTIAAYLLLVIQGNLWPQSDHAGATPSFDATNQ